MHSTDSLGKLCRLRSELVDMLDCQCESVGVASMDTDETGKVVDMIKDLFEAEAYAWKIVRYKDGDPEGHSYEDHLRHIRELWKSSDGDTKRRMKADVTKLSNEMVV